MNIIILKWVLTNLTLLEVAQPDVTQTTVEMLQSDWAATIVASIQGRLKYSLVPIAGVIVRMRFKLPRIWVIVLRT